MSKIKSFIFIILCLLISNVNGVDQLTKEITITSTEQTFDGFMDKSSNYYELALFKATLDQSRSGKEYLFFGFKINKNALIRAYVMTSNDDSKNELNSMYSLVGGVSNIYIPLNKIKNLNSINIRLLCEPFCNLVLYYYFRDNLEFSDNYENNFGKIILPAEKTEPLSINWKISEKMQFINHFFFLSEKTIKSFTMKIKYKIKNSSDAVDITDTVLDSVYPNGYEITISQQILTNITLFSSFEFQIYNNGQNDQEIIFATLVNNDIQSSYQNLINGQQFYFSLYDGTDSVCFGNTDTNTKEFILNSYTKNYQLSLTNGGSYKFSDPSIAVAVKTSSDNTKICFENSDSSDTNKAFHFQYLNIDNEIEAQKQMASLIPGVVKDSIILSQSSLYYFIPKNNQYTKINYFFRPKNNGKFNVSFSSCESYPDECEFPYSKSSKLLTQPVIKNLGLFYTEENHKTKLNTMIVSCIEGPCYYDVMMTYDNGSMILVNGENYTKFIGENNLTDVFILPITKKMKTDLSKMYIELSVLSGNAELFLYDNLDFKEEISNINLTDFGRKQRYLLSPEQLNKKNLYNSEIYAVVKAKNNTLYNILYINENNNDYLGKQLEDFKLNIETLNVSDTKATFSFMDKKCFEGSGNYENYHIFINSLKCQSEVSLNGETSRGYTHHFKQETSKSCYNTFEINLINDNVLCTKGVESDVIMYSYPEDNQEIIINDNTFINTSYIKTDNNVTYKYIFKTENITNGLSIELVKYSTYKNLTATYLIESIRYGKTGLKEILAQKPIITRDLFLVTNDTITKVCGNNTLNDLCSISISFDSNVEAETQIDFSIYIDRIGHNNTRHLSSEEQVITSIESGKYNYYYIDLYKKYNTEILVNSFGQDLNVYTALVTNSNKIENSVNDSIYNRRVILPTKENSVNNTIKYDPYTKKILVTTDEIKNCESICQLFIGVYSPERENGIAFLTTYSIEYNFNENGEARSMTTLPLNYYTKYTFTNNTQTKYYLINLVNEYDSLTLDLELTKDKENDDSDVKLLIKYSGGMVSESSKDAELTSSTGRLTIEKSQLGNNKNIYVLAKPISNDTNVKISYKFRVYNPGKTLNNLVIPINSMEGEICTIEKEYDFCYYSLKINSGNPIENVYFYIPNDEKASISVTEYTTNFIEELNADEINKILTNDSIFDFNSTNEGNKPNSYNYTIQNKNKNEKYLFIGVSSPNIGKFKLLTAYNIKSDNHILEKNHTKLFLINKDETNNQITFKMENNTSSVKKYKINIQSTQGDGSIKIKNWENYIGLESSGKQELNFVLEADNLKEDILLNCTQFAREENLDFVFGINYNLSSIDHSFNEIKFAKVNTFYHYNIEPNSSEVGDIGYYFKVNFTKNDTEKEKYTIYTNIKINTGSKAEYTIKAYVVDEDFIKSKNASVKLPSKYNDVSSKVNSVFAAHNDNSGSVIMKQIEITSSDIEKLDTNTYYYIYITLSTQNKNVNYVKVVINPYDLSGNAPLSPNQFYIQKISQKESVQLLLERTKMSYEKMIIEFVTSLSNKYNIAIAPLQNKSVSITNNDTNILESDKLINRKHILTLKFDTKSNNNSRYIGLNIFPKSGVEQEDTDDYFIFKYKNDYVTKDILTLEDDSVKFNQEDENLILKFKPIKLSKSENYTISYIVNGYYTDTMKKVKFNSKELDIYLGLKGTKTEFTKLYVWDSQKVEKLDDEFSVQLGDYKNEYYYITILAIVQYNDREEYFGYQSEFEEDSSTVWIVILIIFLIIGLIAGGVVAAHYILKNRKGSAVEREISKFIKFDDEEDFASINENRVY